MYHVIVESEKKGTSKKRQSSEAVKLERDNQLYQICISQF